LTEAEYPAHRQPATSASDGQCHAANSNSDPEFEQIEYKSFGSVTNLVDQEPEVTLPTLIVLVSSIYILFTFLFLMHTCVGFWKIPRNAVAWERDDDDHDTNKLELNSKLPTTIRG